MGDKTEYLLKFYFDNQEKITWHLNEKQEDNDLGKNRGRNQSH